MFKVLLRGLILVFGVFAVVEVYASQFLLNLRRKRVFNLSRNKMYYGSKLNSFEHVRIVISQYFNVELYAFYVCL